MHWYRIDCSNNLFWVEHQAQATFFQHVSFVVEARVRARVRARARARAARPLPPATSRTSRARSRPSTPTPIKCPFWRAVDLLTRGVFLNGVGTGPRPYHFSGRDSDCHVACISLYTYSRALPRLRVHRNSCRDIFYIKSIDQHHFPFP